MVIALGALGAFEQGGVMDFITAVGTITAAIINKWRGGPGEDAR
ncbi:hypothetical protein [Streptomyces griseorubiginosus]|nr:hypothetical protein [Streptomyces griseorubiginosus]